MMVNVLQLNSQITQHAPIVIQLKIFASQAVLTTATVQQDTNATATSVWKKRSVLMMLLVTQDLLGHAMWSTHRILSAFTVRMENANLVARMTMTVQAHIQPVAQTTSAMLGQEKFC